MSIFRPEPPTHTFVNLYLKHECLWNPHHDDYRTTFRRQQAYQAMITEFNEATGVLLNEREVRTKINSVRVCYTKIVRRGLNHLGKFNTKLTWFDDLHECLKQFQKEYQPIRKKSSCEEDDDDTGSIEDQNVWRNSDGSDGDTKSDLHTPQHKSIRPYHIIVEGSSPLLKSETDEQESRTEKNPFKIKKRKLNHTSPMKNVEESVTVTEDEYDAFGKFIATQLRGLGLKRALSVQLELHNIVSRARLENLPKDDD